MNDLARRALELIDRTDDAVELRRIAANAHARGEVEVHRAALRRLYAVLPSACPGTLEYDVWQSIHALEEELSMERGKTLRLGRTRQKIQRDGEVGTVAALVTGKMSEGFEMLRVRDMLDLTFEAVAKRHPDRFAPEVLEAATRRLAEYGYSNV